MLAAPEPGTYPVPRLALTLCGRVTAQVEDRPPSDSARPLGAKALALLAYLAVEGGAHARPRLAALLWGEQDDEHARASLRQALAQLRRALGPLLHDEGHAIALDAAVACDVEPLLRGDAEHPPAVDVRRFLTELPLRDAPAFEEWAEATRERLRSRMAGLLARAAARALATRDGRAALDAATRWRALTPLDDEPVLAALRAHELLGDAAGALVLLDAHRRRLRDEEGRAPGHLLASATERIARQAVPRAPTAGSASDAAPRVGADAARALAAAPLQERQVEWERMSRLWRSARAGAGGVVVVDGETGCGRSRLLHDWGVWASGDGAIVLAAPSVEADRRIPFGTLARLVQAALAADGAAGTDGQWLAELARLEPTLHARFPGVPVADGSSPVDGWRVFEALAQLFAALAAESPVLVLLDDLPWCDDESAGLLHALVERTRGAPVLWCVGAGPGPERDAPGSRLVRALVASGATTLHPARLGVRGVWGILGALGEPVDGADTRTRASALVASVRAESEGVPRYVVAQLRGLLERGALVLREDGWETIAPDGAPLAVRLAELRDVRAPLVARLERVPEDARALLVTVALAAVPCDADLLSHVLTLSRLRAAALADGLRARGLLVEEQGAFRCAHRVIAAVVAAEASPVWRHETHRALAESLRRLAGAEPSPAVAAAIAYHGRNASDGVAASPPHSFDVAADRPTDHPHLESHFPLTAAPVVRAAALPGD